MIPWEFLPAACAICLVIGHTIGAMRTEREWWQAEERRDEETT